MLAKLLMLYKRNNSVLEKYLSLFLKDYSQFRNLFEKYSS